MYSCYALSLLLASLLIYRKGMHMKRSTKLISVLLIGTTLAGCNPPPQGGGVGGVSKQDIGTVVGGVGGALVGSAFGGGTGRLLATGAGAIVGGMAGNSVGKSLDREDATNNNQ